MTVDTIPLPNRPVRRGLSLCLGLLVVALVLAGCDSNGGTEIPNVSEDNTVADVVAASQNTGTLESALQQAGLVEALDDSSQSFTVFAPTDAAFGNIDAGELTANDDLLTEVLTYHVVPDSIVASAIQDGGTAVTLEGDTLEFSVSDGTVQVNGATVTRADIEATNGVVHKVDGVLLETVDVVDRAVLTPQLSTLAAAVDAAGLAGSDSPLRNNALTLFAPVDGAFGGINVDALTSNADILSRTLNYHVITGQRIGSGDLPADGQTPATLEGAPIDVTVTDTSATVNGIPVSTTDIQTENGVVHLIDGVLLQRLDIVQRATVTSALSTLASAVGASSALSASDSPLRNDNPATVFAPVNSAFQDVDVDELTADPELLNEVLTYHALSGEVTSGDLQSGPVQTLEGGSVTVNVTDTSVTVDDVPVTTTDIRTRNGVVHLVDDVLLRGVDAVDRTVLTSPLSTTQAAIEAAGLDGPDSPLRGDGPLTIFAPLNSGFDGLEVDELASRPDLAGRVLQYHAISGQRITSDQLSSGETPETLEGGTITVNVTDTSVTLNGVPVSVTDIQTENAVIHLIDGVLLQEINALERATVMANFSILQELVGEAGMEVQNALSGPGPDGEDGITVFAPTNDALLAALDANDNGEIGLGELPSDSELEALLKYHVLDDVFFAEDVPMSETALPTLEGSDVTVVRDGSAVTLNPNNEASSVIAPDVDVSNGVIHGVDTVLQIPSSN